MWNGIERDTRAQLIIGEWKTTPKEQRRWLRWRRDEKARHKA